MALEPFETAEAEELPGVRQLSVFLENRVGETGRRVLKHPLCELIHGFIISARFL